MCRPETMARLCRQTGFLLNHIVGNLLSCCLHDFGFEVKLYIKLKLSINQSTRESILYMEWNTIIITEQKRPEFLSILL